MGIGLRVGESCLKLHGQLPCKKTGTLFDLGKSYSTGFGLEVQVWSKYVIIRYLDPCGYSPIPVGCWVLEVFRLIMLQFYVLVVASHSYAQFGGS